jgi:hypothetical protein
MFRTIKLKLRYGKKLFETAMQFKEVNQIIMDYGFEEFLEFNADQNASRTSTRLVNLSTSGCRQPVNHFNLMKIHLLVEEGKTTISEA